MPLQIQTIRNGVTSERFVLTKKLHRELLKDKPDMVIFLIDYIYPDSPEAGTYVTLDFAIFNVISREKILEENRFKKGDQRHIDNISIEDIDPLSNRALYTTTEDEYFRREQSQALRRGKNTLTSIQRTRLDLNVEDGISRREIAKQEGVQHVTVNESINSAIKKLKKFL